MKIRPFEDGDREVFNKLCHAFYEAGATLRGYDAKLTEMTFDRVLARHENLWGYLMFDKETEEPIGYALLTAYWCNEEGGTVLILDELYISPEHQHRGYATKFMEWMIQEFKGKAVSMTLEVLTSNQTAQQLYRHEGFSPDGFVTYSRKIPLV